MIGANKYDFSFTASSLRLSKLRLVAEHQINGEVTDYINDLGGGKSSTGKRMLAEFNKRLNFLSETEKNLLIKADLTTQKQLAFLSVCKTHAFIRDFVVDVLREKVLVFDYEITEGEYITFFRRKSDVHPEMDDLTDITQNKVRQVTFKILEQAGMIDNIKTKNIQPQLLDSQLIKAIISDDSQWLKVFLMSDLDIENYKN
jgi:hypothetical protein